MGLIKLVHAVIFEQDGSRHSIVEYVSTIKKLFLLFQKKEKSMANYTKAFKALKDMADKAGVTPGWYGETL